jgi:hypothetical protein
MKQKKATPKKIVQEEALAAHPREAARLIGHQAARVRFQQAWLAKEGSAQAWLIAGPKGIGKASLSYQLAAMALGGTPAVSQKVMAGTHPDLLAIEAEAGKDIAADAVRQVSQFMRLTASMSSRRVVMIDSVDALNRHGANALLKALEEPVAGALMLLVCHSLSNVLPTIRSRCMILPLLPLSLKEASEVLLLQDPPIMGAQSQLLLSAADCSPGYALLLEKTGLLARWQPLLESWAKEGVSTATVALLEALPIADAGFDTVARLCSHSLQAIIQMRLGIQEAAWLPEAFRVKMRHASLEQLVRLEHEVTTMLQEALALKLEAKAVLLHLFHIIRLPS